MCFFTQKTKAYCLIIINLDKFVHTAWYLMTKKNNNKNLNDLCYKTIISKIDTFLPQIFIQLVKI